MNASLKGVSACVFLLCALSAPSLGGGDPKSTLIASPMHEDRVGEIAATQGGEPGAGKPRLKGALRLGPGTVRRAESLPGAARAQGDQKPLTFNSAIQHIVFIVKENRTFDQMFGTFPGADGTTTGTISTGQVLTLGHTPDRVSRDIGHGYWDATTGIDNGKMDKFDLITDPSQQCNVNGDYLCMTEHSQADIPNYYSYASTFALGDHTFSSMKGPSMPNHLYTIAAQSGGVVNSPVNSPWGCDAPVGTTVPVVDNEGNLTTQFPCFDFETLGDLLEAAGISWKYYAHVGNDWNAYDAINHVRNTSLWTTNIAPDTQFITDAEDGQLSAVNWLVAQSDESEHPNNSTCNGENWTVNQINAVMEGPRHYDSRLVREHRWHEYGPAVSSVLSAPLIQSALIREWIE